MVQSRASRSFVQAETPQLTQLQRHGRSEARNAALIDAGADLRINTQAKVGLYGYWGQQANTAHENGLRGTLTWMF